MNHDQEDDLKYLRDLVEKMSPYKAVTVGWIVEKNEELTLWRKASTSSLAFEKTWTHVVSLEVLCWRRV